MTTTTAPAAADTVAGKADTSVGKALALLDSFSGPTKVLGVTDLAQRAGIAKSTAHRLLSVLVAGGYLVRVDDRYCLTEHMFEIGNQVRSCRPGGIRERAMPYLAELFAQTRQTVHLAVLSGTEVLYLEKLFGHDTPRIPTTVGGRRPAHATALGKAILARSDADVVEAVLTGRRRAYTPRTIVSTEGLTRSLQRVRETGLAVDHEESLRGVNCVAAPVLDPVSGVPLAAISICSASASLVQRYGPALLRATHDLSRHQLARVA